MIKITLKGVKKVLEALNVDVTAEIEQAIDEALILAQQHASASTPVVTGSMRDAWQSKRTGLMGVMGIDPGARNRVSGVEVIEYAPLVDQRLGILGATVEAVRPMLGANIDFV